jgi:hypothetical protein
MDFWTIIETIGMPVISGIVGWLAGTRKRRNDFLKDMQASIDLLATENRKLMADNLELRKELFEVKYALHQLQVKKGD